MNKLSLGIIGCGRIAQNAYLPNFTGRHASLVRVAACADAMPGAAQKCATMFSIPRVLSPDELLADPDIDLVVNLTIPEAHYDLNQRALLAGKHVYCEKPLATSAGEAFELRDIARERGLMLSCAPDTLLGSMLQNARRSLDDGIIGEVRHVSAWFSLNVRSPRYYRPGVGPVLDFGPYYVGSLVSLLGPVSRVTGLGTTPALETADEPGKTFVPESVSHFAAAFVFASGVTGTLGGSSDARNYESGIEILGNNGRLSVADPNFFNGKITVTDSEKNSRELASEFDLDSQDRGAGVAEMAMALREKRAHRLDADLVVHTTEVLMALIESIRTGHAIDLTTTCRRPVPMSLKSSGNPFAAEEAAVSAACRR